MKKRNLIIIIVLTAAAAAVILWLCFRPSSNRGYSVQSAAAARVDICNSVTATGTVEPVTLVEVGTQVSGIIDRLYVDFNDKVKAGDVIAEMDKVTLEADLKEAEARLASSKTEYEYRLKTYNRTRTLFEKDLVSDSEYDEALYLYESAKNAYEQNQASIVAVRRNLGYAVITAPIDGVVISRAVEEGQTVAAGFETPTLFTIANDLTDMQVVADVDEADIGYVQEGQRVEFTVDAYPDDIFTGEVKQVRLEATTESSVVTYEVVITAANPDLKLKPGLTANVTIFFLDHRDVLAVPSKALRFMPDPGLIREAGLEMAAPATQGRPEGDVVWVLEQGRLTPTAVTVGASDGEMTEVLSGLQEGQTVATGIAAAVQEVREKTMERSPFMPGRPGDRDNNKEKN